MVFVCQSQVMDYQLLTRPSVNSGRVKMRVLWKLFAA